jgi:hypothetical protein
MHHTFMPHRLYASPAHRVYSRHIDPSSNHHNCKTFRLLYVNTENTDFLQWLVVLVSLSIFNHCADIHPFGNATKDRVFVV